jgi:hypothetical protein
MWESLEGGQASVALWAVMAVGLAAAFFGWLLIRANRRTGQPGSSEGEARIRSDDLRIARFCRGS